MSKKRGVEMKVSFNSTVLTREDREWRQLVDNLDKGEGCVFACDYTYPGRYQPWQIGLEDPILRLKAWGRYFEIEAFNKNDEKVLSEIYKDLSQRDCLVELGKGRSASENKALILGRVKAPCETEVMDESLRTHQDSIFSLIRTLLSLFETECPRFGLYGSFGYRLVHQFETLTQGVHGTDDTPDLLLYLPRRLLVKENAYEKSRAITYDISCHQSPELEIFKDVLETKSVLKKSNPIDDIQSTSHYEDLVKKLKPLFQQGELFEAVPSYERLHRTKAKASQLFMDLRKMNPSPFHYLINMGAEQLLGASPEMYVRVKNRVVETCPISGTIPRGKDSISDHQQIRKLLNSKKDEDELTMCTDVDRNDKSKVCDPATIQVLGRRQIELYSHLIHTVDHVSGTLKPDRDAIDAFIAHMWAVTVTGAPKKAAMNWIEANEVSPRQWYGGAVGYLTARGDINTGLTLRGIQLKDGLASVRVGATILNDSDPQMEVLETLTKAAAMEKVLKASEHLTINGVDCLTAEEKGGDEDLHTVELSETIPLEVLVIDHDDSFVHTLAGYFEKMGCRVKTIRQCHIGKYFNTIEKAYPDLIVLSPGPGTPEDFKLHDSIQWALERNIPLFGVCLGLQGIITYFGGRLGQLEVPMHGKASYLRSPSSKNGSGFSEAIERDKKQERDGGQEMNKALFQLDSLIKPPQIGRYHSLYALEIPDSLYCYAVAEDNCPMAIFHKERPIWALQFHPESIMSAEETFGSQIIENLIEKIRGIKL